MGGRWRLQGWGRARGSGVLLTCMLVLAACSGDATDDPAPADGGGAAAAADDGADAGPDDAAAAPPADAPGAGTAVVSVDGMEFTFDGAISCQTSDEDYNVAYVLGDDEVRFASGGFNNDGWNANALLRIANPADEPGPVQYTVVITEQRDGFVVGDGTVTFEGEWEKIPAGEIDGVDVGTGSFAVTC